MASPSPTLNHRSSHAVAASSMKYATSAPASSGQNPPVCQNCTTSTTPLWRRDELGSVLCNACGLFLKLHGKPRPISLKTDVIKSRNRVKTAGQGPKKNLKVLPPADANGLDAVRAAAGTPPIDALNHRRTSQKISSGHSERSNSPLSRTGTPGLNHHPSNIAPQHMFDGVTLNGHDFHSPSLPGFGMRQPSPGASSINGSHLQPPMSYDDALGTNNTLKTRVSELEVINDLFRGRVTELEQSEQRARLDLDAARESENRMRIELEETLARETELKRRVDELEAELADADKEGPRAKRMRLSDIVDESAEVTPLSTPSQSN